MNYQTNWRKATEGYLTTAGEELTLEAQTMGNDMAILSDSEDGQNRIALDRLTPDDWAVLIPMVLKGSKPPHVTISRNHTTGEKGAE